MLSSRDHGGRDCDRAAPARIMLAGRFARPGSMDRSLIEALIGAEHDVLPGPACADPARLLEEASAAADLVVVDLSGSVTSVLALVAGLRLAVDDAQVPLLGVMPSGIDARSAVYLSAVVDETVSHAQMVERLSGAVRRTWREHAAPGDAWSDADRFATRH